jgi:RNA polymerase sigma factor for flagellar operon FliA
MANELLTLDTGDRSDPATAEEDLRWLKSRTSAMAVVYLASTGETSDNGDNGRRGVQLADDAARSPAVLAMEGELREKLHEIIAALPSDAGALIRGVYFEGLTLQEAGRRLGISKAWASRLHAKTLGRLAHSLRLLGAT